MMFSTNKAIKKMIGSTKRGGRRDWDGDGVRNKKDCQPRNTMRQDTPTNEGIKFKFSFKARHKYGFFPLSSEKMEVVAKDEHSAIDKIINIYNRSNYRVFDFKQI